MGDVHQVVDETTGRRLALKRLRGVHGSTDIALRFRREFHTIAGLAHPGIVTVHDFGLDADGPYYTMELLEGSDLRELGECSTRDVCTMMRRVASALALLHAHRLLHRDLKPRNVRCDAAGDPKLIDFGVLATIGISGEIAGTPASIPPEALRGLPLDGRSDLFGLGALTYFMLTGRNAYPATKLDELERLWREEVPPPSAYREDVSPALDGLVMSLLSLEPRGRPADAAEVVARFEAVGELPPDPSLDVARGWLTSAALVGRDHELDRIRRALRGALDSRGGTVLLGGASGMGKTRLMRELELLAQIEGAIVARARARIDIHEPYAVVRQLAASLVASCRSDASAALPGLGAAVRVVPVLAGLASEPIPKPLPDPAEQRLREQEAVRAWFLRIAERRAVVLAIDDLQRCDEASAAVIAGLAHDAHRCCLLVCGSDRSDEPVVAPQAMRSTRAAADRIELTGLDPDETVELCRTLFGTTEGIERLADWMTRVGQGNPMHCTELARHLVERKVLTYDRGQWHVPERFDDLTLPSVLADAVQLRLSRLSPVARELAEHLSLANRRLDLGLCSSLLREREPTEVLDALRELVFEEVLLEGERGLEFRHDALAESVRRGIDEERTAGLHLRLAEALDARLSERPDVSDPDRHRIGWHYLRGGQAIKGATRLEQTGRELYDAHSFADSIRPLEAALEVWRTQPGTRLRCLDVRHLLTRAGVIADRSVILRHAQPAIEAYTEDAGLRWVARLEPIVGSKLAVLLAVGLASLVWLWRRSAHVSPVQAVTGLMATVNYAASVHSLAYDIPPIERLRERVQPFAGFSNRVPGGACLLIDNFRALAIGHFYAVVRNADRIVEIIDRDRLTPLLDIDRKLAKGAAQFMAASVLALDQDPAVERYLEELRTSNLRFFELSAYNIEAFQHRMRGDEARARALVARSNLLGVQLGNSWVFRSQITWISAIAFGLTGDVLGLDQTLRDLEAFREEGYAFEPWIAYTRAERLRLNGDPEGSILEARAGLQQLDEDELIVRQLLTAVLVDALGMAGRHEEVVEVATEMLDRSDDQPSILRTSALRLGCAVAVARAARGQVERARTDAGKLLGEADAMGSPMLGGLVHEALAAVARHAEDASAHRHHARRAAALFSGTGTSVLETRGRRLLAPTKAGEATGPWSTAGDVPSTRVFAEELSHPSDTSDADDTTVQHPADDSGEPLLHSD